MQYLFSKTLLDLETQSFVSHYRPPVLNRIFFCLLADDGETTDETQLLDDYENSEDEEYTEQASSRLSHLTKVI